MRKIDIGELLSRFNILKRKHYLKVTSLLLVFLMVFQCCVIMPSTKAYAGVSLWDTTLRSGDTGPNVVALQYILRGQGYDISVNGDYDSQTEDAIYDLQRGYGWHVDGVCNGDILVKILPTVYNGDDVESDYISAC